MNSATPSAAVAAELNEELMRFVRVLKTTSHSEVGADRSALLLLWPLVHDGPMRLRDLAEAKGSDASTVSRQAAELVRAGLIRRDPDPDDRRACLLAVTDGGRTAWQRMIDARRDMIADALQDWAPERLRLFTELFREFNRAVEARQTSPANQGTTKQHQTAQPPAGADRVRETV
jgi:DNA-binding MarR family transcriptional regulator